MNKTHESTRLCSYELFPIACTSVVLVLFILTEWLYAKPRPPISIDILTVQSISVPSDVKPGESIELQAVVHAEIDVHELTITIVPAGGACITAGDRSWTGSASRNSDTRVRFTVRVPEQGQGSVRATAVVPGHDGAGLTSSAVYVLGGKPVIQKKALSRDQNLIRKNRDGRDVIEHPVK